MGHWKFQKIRNKLLTLFVCSRERFWALVSFGFYLVWFLALWIIVIIKMYALGTCISNSWTSTSLRSLTAKCERVNIFPVWETIGHGCCIIPDMYKNSRGHHFCWVYGIGLFSHTSVVMNSFRYEMSEVINTCFNSQSAQA